MQLSPLKPSSSSESTPSGIENRRSRRRRLKQASQEGQSEASGSTLPARPSSAAGGSTSTPRSIRAADTVHSEASGSTLPAKSTWAADGAQPEASRSTLLAKPTGVDGDAQQHAVIGFEKGEDFIAFGFEDDFDEEVMQILPGQAKSGRDLSKRGDAVGKERDKGKGKQRESSAARDRTPARDDKERDRKDRRRERDEDRDRDRGRDREDDKRERDRDRKRDRSRDRDRRDRDKNRDRDHDRDRDGSHGTKRKVDFDANDGYTNKKQRTDASSRKSPWVNGLSWDGCHHVAEMLHREVEAFVDYISPSPAEDEVRTLIISLITKAVVSSFPDASVFPFGSYETKLYLPLGDIDLVILSKSMAYNDKVTVLHALANTLKRSGITDRVTIIAKAKVPIVKFITRHGRFNVDMSINQENGIVSGNIINGFLKNMNGGGNDEKGCLALRSLVMITKAFLSQRSMNEVFSGGLGSYSIVCLAISFLQMHPKIRRSEIDADKNLGVLVMEFFELYGCYFNYEEVGISVRDGGTYFSKKQRGWYDYYKGNLLSIEDPADPSNDISKGSFAFQKVRTTFAGAHGILTSTAYLVAGILSARRQGRSVHLRDHDESEELSILSSVMGVTQETVNHRKLVQELHDKRVLHNLLGVIPLPVVINGSTKSSKVVVNGVNGSGKPSSSTSRAASSVKSAWQEADGEHDDEHHKRRREVDPADDEEEGRYDINRQQPAHKRLKTGRMRDMHTLFITDDESLSESEQEEAHYASDIEITGPSRSKDPEKIDKRRSYWLSKAIGIEGTSSGD